MFLTSSRSVFLDSPTLRTSVLLDRETTPLGWIDDQLNFWLQFYKICSPSWKSNVLDFVRSSLWLTSRDKTNVFQIDYCDKAFTAFTPAISLTIRKFLYITRRLHLLLYYVRRSGIASVDRNNPYPVQIERYHPHSFPPRFAPNPVPHFTASLPVCSCARVISTITPCVLR